MIDFLAVDNFIVTSNYFNPLYGAFGIVGLGILIAGVSTKLNNIFLKKGFDTKLSEFIPFERFLNDEKTIVCSNESFVRVFKIEGVSSFFAKNEVKNSLFEAKKSWIDSLDNKDVDCRIINIREKEKNYVKSEFENDVLQSISDKWNSENNMVFNNSHYVVLSVKNSTHALDDLNELSYSLKAILDPFGIQELKIKDFPKDNPLTPFIKILNPVSKPSIKFEDVKQSNIFDVITSEEVFFSKKGNIRFSYGDEKKYMAVVGIKNIADFSNEQMIEDILALNFEINILDHFSSYKKAKAQALLVNQKNATVGTSFSYENVAQFDDALSSIDASDEDHQILLKYSKTFYVYAETEEELDKNVFELIKILRVYGVVPCREGWISQASWFLNFPGFEDAPRIYNILSKAVACFLSFEKQPKGFDKSDWGDGAITHFPTSQGTVYQFQYHISPDDGAVGHTISIGPTGQGKTTLYAFLAGQAMRHEKLRTFFFDRYRGVEIFANAIDGDYINFNLGSKFKEKISLKNDKDVIGTSGILDKQVSLNPFKMEDTPESRSFLKRWLAEITLATDYKSTEEIGRAITTAYDYLDPSERSLKKLYDSCFSATGYMKKELKKWVDDNEYGAVFNAQDDSLKLNNRFVGFDFTYILEDDFLAPAVVSYIMNRIQNITGSTGDPSLIIIDETAPMLKNQLFRKNFAIGLQEGRKKRQVYMAAFQEPSIIDKLGMGEVIRGQAQTEVFFRNPMATAKDYENWKLTPKEFAFIQGRLHRDLKYAILLRKPAIGESVILNVDLSSLDKQLMLFNSGRKHVLMAEELKKQYGTDWVQRFLNK